MRGVLAPEAASVLRRKTAASQIYDSKRIWFRQYYQVYKQKIKIKMAVL